MQRFSGTSAAVSGTARPWLPAVLTSVFLVSPCAFAEPVSYRIDPEHVVVAFLVDHLGFAKVLGSFGDVSGTFIFDEDTGHVSDLAVTVGTGSVSSQHDERDGHLRSGDFLDTAAFPEMTFSAESADPASGREYEIEGELTLLGVSRPLTLNATWNKSDDYPMGRNAYAIGVSARALLDRSDFGMTYGVDNGWVGDSVEILIEFEARRE